MDATTRHRGSAVLCALLLSAAAAGCAGAAKPEVASPVAYNSYAESPATGAPAQAAPAAPRAPTNGYLAQAPSPPAAPMAAAGARQPAAPKSVADVPHSAAMIIYTAALAMAVFQVTEAMGAVERIGRDVDGYLAVRGDNAITIRVPRDRFDEAIARVEKLGDVVHRDIKAQDVTDQVVDLQARLKNAQAMRDQLLELLRRATVKEALEIETQLGRITEQIEVMEGKLKVLRDQIAYSTITVQFAPIAEQSVHETSLLLPFPWLQDLGLDKLLNVPR
jgi:hypothetical protein